jgi:NAD(P)H-hydrate repair Nnr-like enzyme with NAD(P)H-hydrate dehydratase domain
MIYSTELRRLLPRRARGSHKGTYGHLLLVGGARGYAGRSDWRVARRRGRVSV